MRTEAAVLAMALAAAGALAAEPAYLDAEEVRTLIVGKTIEVQDSSGQTFRVYFDPNGQRVILQAGGESALPWLILADGTQCVKTATGDDCARIARNSDGTYTRYRDGKPIYRWLKILSGKDLAVPAQAPGVYARQIGPDRYEAMVQDPALTEQRARELITNFAGSLCKSLAPVLGAFHFESKQPVGAGAASGNFQYIQEISCVPGVKMAQAPRRPTLKTAEESRRIEQQILAKTESYFQLLATGRLDETYAQVDAQALGKDRDSWMRDKQAFRELAGEPVRVSISKVTVYDNPPEAQEPGLYVAADYTNEYRNVPFHCGYLMWFRPIGAADFRVTREETGQITAEQLKSIPAAQLPEIKRSLRCVTP